MVSFHSNITVTKKEGMQLYVFSGIQPRSLLFLSPVITRKDPADSAPAHHATPPPHFRNTKQFMVHATWFVSLEVLFAGGSWFSEENESIWS